MTHDPRLAADPLPGPFAPQSGPEMATPAVVEALAAGQVKALLEAAPAFYQLPAEQREKMRTDLSRITSYTAGLIHDDWSQSAKLHQTPMVRTREVTQGEITRRGTPARALADGFQRTEDGGFTPVAASNIARITQDTLNAIAFPTFVADLIKGTFQAIVDASIQQMEAYATLLSNVAKTVEQFANDNITDNNARDWLVGAYPRHITLDTSGDQPRLTLAKGAEDAPPPDWQGDLNIGADFSLDEQSLEDTLVPSARRKMAQNRQQTLATMVLMGMNRIVVTKGRIKAGMGFRIDTTDRSTSKYASNFEAKHESQAKYGWFLSPVSASVKNSVTYVSSTKKDSESELDVSADLTGEVDLQFKSDYFPLERFASTGVIAQIQQNTPNPAANKPITGAPAPGAAAQT
ncbi:MAG: hypothetical protein ACRCS3_14515 [Paracoccaceae bacterium]